MKRLLTALIGALVLGVFIAGPLAAPAAAHDRLIKSTPKKNGKLDELSEVELTFSADVQLPKVIITGSNGDRQDIGKATAKKTEVIAPVAGGLEPGKYVLAYRVVSSDGHAIKGEIPFTITGVAERPTAEPTRPATPQTPASAQTPASPQESTSAKVGPWIWGAAGLLAGVGVGLAIILRKNKPSS